MIKRTVVFVCVFLVLGLIGQYVLLLKDPIFLMVYGSWIAVVAEWAAETSEKLPGHE
jgi:hypothetical protein